MLRCAWGIGECVLTNFDNCVGGKMDDGQCARRFKRGSADADRDDTQYAADFWN